MSQLNEKKNNLAKKLKTGERLTLSERGLYDEIHGEGRVPNRKDHPLPNWMKKKKIDRIYGYFNNHYHGYAVENCIEILEMLNVAQPEHGRIKEKIIQHNIQRMATKHAKNLDDFGFSSR